MESSPLSSDQVPKVSMKSLARVLSKLAPTNSTCLSYNGFTKQVLPFFELLRALGQCPLVFETVEDHRGSRRVVYDFKFCRRPGFILSLVAALFIVSCSILGVLHSQAQLSVLGDLWPPAPIRQESYQDSRKRLDIMSFLILVAFEVIFTLVVVVEYIIGWTTSSTLSKWLNEWNNIEADMDNCQGMVHNLDLSKFWKYFAIPYIMIPTIALGTPILITEWDGRYPAGVIVTLVFSYLATACVQTQDVKVIVMFKAIEMSFKKVRQTIQVRYDKTTFHKHFDILEKNEIRSWQKVLIRIRKQAESAGKYMTVHQLTSIATCIFFASAALFVSSKLIGEQPNNETVPLVVIFTFISFVRVIAKIIMAVRITEEERRLASLLKDFELIEENEECQREMKGIFDMLVHCPTEISLNNYVKLNNALILGICGQVLTQFIVYQQFQNAK